MTVDDYEAVRALYEEPGMLAYMPSFFPAEEPEAYFESYVKNMYRFYDFGMYVLEDARTGRIIGHVGLGVEDGTESDGGRTAQTEESGRNDSRGSDRWRKRKQETRKNILFKWFLFPVSLQNRKNAPLTW